MASLKDGKRILVTSALPYANGPIHLGHLAGAYLPADIFVRYSRLRKRDIVYICGSDENGVPIMLRARAEGKSPQEIVDRYDGMIRKAFEGCGISFDYYGRTSSKTHHQTSQTFFSALAEKDVFLLKKEEQLYDPEAGLFLADRFIYGTCPSCGYEKAYGDQCEKCGTSLSPKELIDPKSTITDAEPVLRETTHWYLPLERLQADLEKWLEAHDDWKPNVLGQIRSWLTEGLRDRAVTRDLPWGIDIPPAVAERAGVDGKGKKLYVWFDAPIGYISATREWAEKSGDPDRWKQYWQDQDTTLIHFIGKDNIVFHCLIFPAMLMAHGDFVLPEYVPANEFLNLEGNKFSTSRNYAVWLHDYLERFGPDSLRYTLAANLPETRDADFSWSEFQARHNNELADILGNFINRAFTFLGKNFEGRLPEAVTPDALDRELLERIAETGTSMGKHIDAFRFKEATRALMDLARFANKYFNDQAPWKTLKTDRDKCASTLHFCAQATASLAVYMHPLLPFTSEKVWQLLQLPGAVESASWEAAAEPMLETGHAFNKPKILFRKIEDAPIQAEIEKLQRALASEGDGNAAAADEKRDKPQDQITIEDFGRIDLRIARVIEAEKLAGADRLLKLRVALGDEERQIIAGIAKHYSPESLAGRHVVVVANLKPAKLRGELSQGMVLAAEGEDGRFALVSPDSDIEPGSRVK